VAVYTSLVTNVGRALIAEAQAGGGTVYPFAVLTGDGILALNDDPYSFTTLKHEVEEFPINSSNALTPGQANFEFLIDSSTVTEAYLLNEIGLYCTLGDPEGEPVLIYYAYTTGGDTISPTSTSNAVIDSNFLAIVFSEATSCIATLTAAIPPALHAVTHLLPGGDDPIPVASSTSDGFVPITPGDASKVLLGGTTAAFGSLPPHAPTHKGNSGSDPLPLADISGSGALHATDDNPQHVLIGNNTFAAIPLHGVTHTSIGSDPVPIATVNATGLLIPLSGNPAQVLQGNGAWGAGRMAGEIVTWAGASAPVGWLICNGAAISRTTYAALYGIIGNLYGSGDGTTTFNLPDCRGRALIGAGQGAGLTNRLLGSVGGEENHSLSSAEMPQHSHAVIDNGHTHSVHDPEHSHSLAQNPHSHNLVDPGHAHTVPLHTQIGGYHTTADFSQYIGSPGVWVRQVNAGAPIDNISVFDEGSTALSTGSNISIVAATVGITVNPAFTGISLFSSGTGISLGATGGNTPHANMQPWLAVNQIIKY
jgi:microcystin-dependent protein